MSKSDSAASVPTFSSEEYQTLYEDKKLLTEDLYKNVMDNVILPNSTMLRAADQLYRLDAVLYAMLEYAPHPLGVRYVAVSLLVAYQLGEDGLVNAARSWLDHLLLPSQFINIYLFI